MKLRYFFAHCIRENRTLMSEVMLKSIIMVREDTE